MKVYAPEAVYDDPWSYCDTRYKIAGQWYGIPKLFDSKTLEIEVVENSTRSQSPSQPSSSPPSSSDNVSIRPGETGRIIYKQKQRYSLRGIHLSKDVNSLVTLSLGMVDGEEKVRYHKDMWNEKDYSHEGIGRAMKELNGDYLTKITRPPAWLKEGAEREDGVDAK